MERLSSGYRINRAADDAAGLAISEKLRGQIGPRAGQRNVQDAVSLVQTAEGSPDEVHSMLQRVRELAVQYKNGTLSRRTRPRSRPRSTSSRRRSSASARRGVQRHQLLTSRATITFQVGANDGHAITVHDLAPRTPIGTRSRFARTTAGDLGDRPAIDDVSSRRAATFGAVQNRLEHTLNNLATYQENLTASESRIRDVDMAAEMVQFTKNQILQQAGTSMLAQANQAPQGVLSLLR